MQKHNFTVTQKHTISVPMSATKAADTFVAIANGNANTKRNEVIRKTVKGNMSISKPLGHMTPLSLEVVASVLGNEFACNVNRTMTNVAYAKYFNSVCVRLRETNMLLSYSEQCWFLIKLPNATDSDYFYDQDAMAAQNPNGVQPIDTTPIPY